MSESVVNEYLSLRVGGYGALRTPVGWTLVSGQ